MMFVSLIVVTSAQAGLRINPDAPPVATSADRYRFGDVELQVTDGVILHLDPGVQPPPGAQHLGGRSWRLSTQSASAAIAAAVELDRGAGVLAFPDVVLDKQRASFDDPLREGQWYLDHLEMDPLYAVTLGDPDVRIAVIDSGIDISHDDLSAAVLAPYDAFSDDDDPSPDPGEYCNGGTGICDEHGTAVSGVVAARANNGVGMVGLCPECTLVPIKLLGEGSGTLGSDVAAFEHAIAQDVAVINNSWGYTRPVEVPQVLAEVIGRAATETRGGLGALVVFAAGNDDREIRDNELQSLDTVLCVTATDSYGRYTNYTNYGDPVDIAAPSATVSITPEQGSTTTFGGTSAAAPVVSGLAGWVLSVQPDLSAQELHALLVATARESPLVTHDENGHHPYYGYGELSPTALLAALNGDGGDTGADGNSGSDDGSAAQQSDDKGGCQTTPAGGVAGLLVGLVGLAGRRTP